MKKMAIKKSKQNKKNDPPTKSIANYFKAKQLMSKSDKLKDNADWQEKVGKAQIRSPKPKNASHWNAGIFSSSDPFGKERLDIAKKFRTQATKDSLSAVKLYPGIVKKK